MDYPSESKAKRASNSVEADDKIFSTRRKSLGLAEIVDFTVMLKRWRSISTERRKLPKKRHGIRHSAKNGASSDHSCSILMEADIPDGAKRPRLFGRDLTDLTQPEDLNRCLMRYFVKVSDCHGEVFSDSLDVELIANLLSRGADLNTRDRNQQTVLHDVARNWSTDVMDLMSHSGGDVKAADYMGWTPLHVAAASDYPEMCRLLLNLGADKEAKANNGQTPLFFAAKTDSTKSLKALIKLGCDMNAKDYRGRTPLFVACELDRSATAALLLEHGADAFAKDDTGQIAFVPLIEKMPPLAPEALKQLHKTYRIERSQMLNLLKLDPLEVTYDEKAKRHVVEPVPYHSALGAIIKTNNYQVINLPLISALIDVQWKSYGRIRAIGQIILQLINIILWTVFAVGKEWTQRYEYVFPDDIYRIIVLALAICITIYLIVDEIMEYAKARQRHNAWKTWKLDLINKDRSFLHRSHTDEGEYLAKEMDEVNGARIAYFDDWWNYLDWSCYTILLASVISHFVDVGWPGRQGNLVVARWHVRIMALNIVVLWIRLLKYVKPFEFFGPFIVMLGFVLNDLFKFFFFYLEFFIPFVCIFWTLLGGTGNLQEADIAHSGTLKNYSNYNFTRITVTNMDSVENLLVTMFRLTLVDSYDYANMVAIDPITAQFMLGGWFAISAIIFINLFIAQLSETFKTVIDNAKAAAAMQKASTLRDCYDTMRMSAKVQYHKTIKEHCSPLKMHYDDDVTKHNPVEELQKATLEIRSMAEELQMKLSRLYKREIVHSDSDENDLATDQEQEVDKKDKRKKTKSKHLAEKAALSVRSRLEKLEDETHSDLTAIRLMLRDIAIVVAGLTRTESPGPGSIPPSKEDEGSATSVRHVTVAAGGRRQQQQQPQQQQQHVDGGGGITEIEPMMPLYYRPNNA